MGFNGKKINNEYTHGKPSPHRSNPNKNDVLFSTEGQWKYPGQVTKIPSGNITMRGVDYPVLGVDNYGNKQLMMPEMNYSFPGQYVTEHPLNLNLPQMSGDHRPDVYGRGFGSPTYVEGTVGANFGANNLEVKMGTPTRGFNPNFGVKLSRTFRTGGWLDNLPQAQDGLSGPNPGIDPPVKTTASNIGAVNEDELFDQYEELQKKLEEEHKQVARVRGNLMPAAQALDKADDAILNDYSGPAYQAFQKANFAKDPKELREAIKAYPADLKNVLPARGNYNLGAWDSKTNDWDPQRRPGRELYCTPYGCFTYQKAGAKDVPIISGNEGFQAGVKKGNLPFKKVSASEAEPGDMALVIGPTSGSYTDPTQKSRVRAHHTTVLADKPKLDAKGKATGFTMYNANDGKRLKYMKEYRNKASHNDTDYEFYRYIGQTQKYEQQLDDIRHKWSATPIEPKPISLPKVEEPELELRQDGGGSIVNYLASQGKDYSKAARQKLAQEAGIKDYDFSAAKNTELLNKLQTTKAQPTPVVAKQAAPSNYMVKPIGKTYAAPTMPDYSNLSPANQAILNKLAAKDPGKAKQLAAQARELDIKKKFENLDDAEKIVERYKRIRESDEGEGNMLKKDFWTRENWAKTTQATADKLRLFPNDPNSFIDEYLNPGVLVGNMVSSIGSAPLKAKEEDSVMPYFKAAAEPVALGALGINPFDFVGSGAVKTAGKEVLKAGEKAVIKQGLKRAEANLPEAFASNIPVSEAEKLAMQSAKDIGADLNKVMNPNYANKLRTQGFTKDAAAELQRRDIIKKIGDTHANNPESLDKFLKGYSDFNPATTGLNTPKKFMKEYNKVMNSAEMLPTRKPGSFVPKEQAPIKKVDIMTDINAIPKTQQRAALKEIESDPLLKQQAGVKGIIDGKLTKKGFENTHMPIASKEQQLLARKNQVMKRLFGDARTNPRKDMGDVLKQVEEAPEGSVLMGSHSLSDSSFPLYTAHASKAIANGQAKPLFMGYQELNPWGFLKQGEVDLQTITNNLNEHIGKFNVNVAGKAKLPQAYMKNGKVYYPNMALQKGAAEELGINKLSKQASYKPNVNKAAGRTFSGLTREERQAIGSKMISQNIPYEQPGPSLLAAGTGSYALGGNWLDDLRHGGQPMSAPSLKKKARKYGTSKNIQSSINKIFLRNQDIFGPSGRNIYNPNSKFEQGGGWLDNLT